MSIGYPDYGGVSVNFTRPIGNEITTTVASRTLVTQLVPTRLNRARGLIINNASKNLYVYFGEITGVNLVASEPFTVVYANGGSMFIYEDFTAPIYGIWTGSGTVSVNGNAIIHELLYQ